MTDKPDTHDAKKPAPRHYTLDAETGHYITREPPPPAWTIAGQATAKLGEGKRD